MQYTKWLQHYQFLDGRYLITMDGSQYFSSYQVNCECCLTATKNGTVRYHHDILQTAIVHPDKRLGRLMIDALFDRDYPIISGINLFFAVAVMVINLLVDVLYAYLDPRVQYG